MEISQENNSIFIKAFTLPAGVMSKICYIVTGLWPVLAAPFMFLPHISFRRLSATVRSWF